MDTTQIIYPTLRLLANPKIFIAIANHFDGPDWEVFASAFYDLIESQFLDDDSVEPDLDKCPEVCFRFDPDEPDVFQVILSNGEAIELRPDEDGDTYSLISSEEDLGVVSAIYGRLVKAIEAARPDLEGNIALAKMPTAANSFLRSNNGDNFSGEFHLLSDPDQTFDFVVDIVDLSSDDLRAEVTPK